MYTKNILGYLKGFPNMAGLVAQYNMIPLIRNVNSTTTIEAAAGVNPIDLTPQQLPNQRGQLTMTGQSVDNSFMWSLRIFGGFGEFPNDFTQNFTFTEGSNVNCAVTTQQLNRIAVTTPVGDAGGRVYVLQFFPFQSFGPTVRQTTANVLTDDFIMRTTTFNLVSG